ncbi:MAG: trehalose-phosphatase [Candidatus Omnitrophica bacterium]|nr:trehalose-phosphatase [Candidatus Omnitrophota bacterium]
MKYLFKDWGRFYSNIKRAPGVFLFLDYDGTLTPIVSRPEDARLPNAVKTLIKQLQKDHRFNIAIISGRSLKDIKKMVSIREIIYAGNHGLEISGAGGKADMFKAGGASTKYLFKKIKTSLEKQLSRVKGAWVEDKGCTLSVHFRLVEGKKKPLVKKLFRKTITPYILAKRVKVSSGKMVLEVRPGVEWDKGKAVLRILGRRKVLPVYIGDDVTDMDAFRAIKGRGISIFVGSPKPGIKADYFLKNPKEVKHLLKSLTSVQG